MCAVCACCNGRRRRFVRAVVAQKIKENQNDVESRIGRLHSKLKVRSYDRWSFADADAFCACASQGAIKLFATASSKFS